MQNDPFRDLRRPRGVGQPRPKIMFDKEVGMMEGN